MVGWVTNLVDGLAGLPAYVLIATLVFAETALFVGFVIPGETAMLVGGFLAVHHKVSLPVVFVVAAAAAIAGDNVGFVIGRRIGPRLRTSRVARRLGPERWARSESLLDRLGGKAIFAARFVTVARAVVPTLAGTSPMRYRTFLPWNAAGGLTWAGAAVGLGYAAGNSLKVAEHYLNLAWIPIVIVAALLYGWHRYRRRRSESAAQTEVPAAADVPVGAEPEPEPEAPTP